MDRFLELAGKSFELKFSEAMFAGGILQIASMAIRIYSKNVTIPPSCQGIVPPKKDGALPFCIGRERYGLPIGLIIYAARNQYNHWDEGKPNTVTENVFDHLSRAFHNNPLLDLAFSLSNPTINVYAHEMLINCLGWISYDYYSDDMRSMLS